MNTLVIADPHFEHRQIILHCRRPWCVPNPAYDQALPYDFQFNNPLMVTKESLEAHDQALSDNWNRMVGKKDRVIIVGDFAFANHARWASSLNGQKVLIRGNHDDMKQADFKFFNEVYDFGCVKKIGTGRLHASGRQVKESITFCHYAMRSWQGSCSNTASLHGHSHGRLLEFDNLLSFDVGVDVWGYIPIPWEAIQKKIEIKRALMQVGNTNPDKATNKSIYFADSEKRMAFTREKNLMILKSIGITIGPDAVALPADCAQAIEVHENAEKMVSAVVATSDTVNPKGIVYTKSALRQLADGKVFFWNEDSGQLSVRCRLGTLNNYQKVSDLFKQRISETNPSIWTQPTMSTSMVSDTSNSIVEEGDSDV